MPTTTITTAILTLLWPLLAAAASTPVPACPNPVVGVIPAPSTAPGFQSRVIVTSANSSTPLVAPRSIKFDSAGNLLVVEAGKGVSVLKLGDDGGTCLYAKSYELIIPDTTLNHGLELSPDGNTLYASSVGIVYAYGYSAAAATNTTPGVPILKGMYNTDHNTRTLLLSRFAPGVMIVNRGSGENLDPLALKKSSGHAQVKAFNLSALAAGSTYHWNADGRLLGWGLRNNVGLSEEPASGGVWTVENSADQIYRDGRNVHENNPGERLNYLGTLVNNTSANQGSNFGYPDCFAAWKWRALPRHKGLDTGMLFTIDGAPANVTDAWCQAERTPPRLTFQAHMAPLDILFNTVGSEAWITFHGSWDRTIEVGRKVSRVAFADGAPVAPKDSRDALEDIVRNGNITATCGDCFRPVGLAWDAVGRLYFSSDQTGEIYVVAGMSPSE